MTAKTRTTSQPDNHGINRRIPRPERELAHGLPNEKPDDQLTPAEQAVRLYRAAARRVGLSRGRKAK